MSPTPATIYVLSGSSSNVSSATSISKPALWSVFIMEIRGKLPSHPIKTTIGLRLLAPENGMRYRMNMTMIDMIAIVIPINVRSPGLSLICLPVPVLPVCELLFMLHRP